MQPSLKLSKAFIKSIGRNVVLGDRLHPLPAVRGAEAAQRGESPGHDVRHQHLRLARRRRGAHQLRRRGLRVQVRSHQKPLLLFVLVSRNSFMLIQTVLDASSLPTATSHCRLRECRAVPRATSTSRSRPKTVAASCSNSATRRTTKTIWIWALLADLN